MERTLYRLTHIISAAGVGGGERQLLLLARYLHGSEFHFNFILPERGSFCDELERAGLTYDIVAMQSKFSIGARSAVSTILKKSRTDLVHCHGARANWYGRAAAKGAGVGKIFCTVHNSLKNYPYSAWRRRLYVMLERQTARLVTQWIAVSDAIRQDLIEYYKLPPEKIEVVANGIDLKDLQVRKNREEVRRELRIESGTVVLLEVARMTHQKGHCFFLEAVARIVHTLPNIRCILAGDGPTRPLLERQAKELGIEQYVDFLGFRSDVADLLSAADLYVLPSISEGMPMGVLEAMALGCPVVASAVDGVPEVIQDRINGRLVPAADVTALARVLEELAVDPDMRDKLAQAGCESFQQHFTADRMAHRVGSLYRTYLPVN